jgi:hypothetical protein
VITWGSAPFGRAFGVFSTVFGATSIIKPGPPKLTGGNVFLTCFIILLWLISLETVN